MATKCIVDCFDYNGTPAIFMMDTTDFRLGTVNYKIRGIASIGTYKNGGINKSGRKYRIAVAGGKKYMVYSDFSVSPMQG